MRLVRDTVHGFRERPHYQESELDLMFEKLVTDFMKAKYGCVDFPFTTDDITTLIEQHVSDLDQYADLNCYDGEVEGITEFPKAGKPLVKISERLHDIPNRLRTTLTHEFGHVVLHTYLFALERQQMKLGPNQKQNAIYCKRDNMVSASKYDWLEWQAGYASGSVLMPKGAVTKVVGSIQERNGFFGAVPAESVEGKKLIAATMERFAVSRQAANVRLSVLKFLGPRPATGSLF